MAPGAAKARAISAGRGGADVGGAHAAAGGGDDDAPEEDLSDNVTGRQRLARGDAAAALAGADVTVSGRLQTPWVYQAYLEPQSATAWRDFDGTLVVQSATQGAFATRQALWRQLSHGEDRLAGKRVVIWEFASRELSVGDWKQFDWSHSEAN